MRRLLIVALLLAVTPLMAQGQAAVNYSFNTLASRTASRATTGSIRLANNTDKVCWRNAADGANLCFYMTSGNLFSFDAGITGTTAAFSGQVTSTLSTGTAPFVVASTTNVANLNASTLSGATFAAPGAIGGGTPGSGAFTTLSATGVITSTLSTGTAPFTLASTTKSTNLNADLLDDANTATAGTASTIALRDGSGNLTGNVIVSTVSTGTAPLTVSSTTNVANLNASSLAGATFAAPGAIGGGTPSTGTFTTLSGTTSTTSPLYNTTTNCASSGGTCSAAASGSVSIAAAATTVTVATTAVTANSVIIITEDSSLGTKLGITCNTTIARNYAITARTAATSFVITTDVAPVTNPACLNYWIIN